MLPVTDAERPVWKHGLLEATNDWDGSWMEVLALLIS